MRRTAQSGQALVEFVLLIPMLIMMVWGAWYFAELVRERLHAQQAARYAAFASAHSALTNYNGSRTKITVPRLQAETSDYVYANLLVQAEMLRAYGDVAMPGSIKFIDQAFNKYIGLEVPDVLGAIAQLGINVTANTLNTHQKPVTFISDKAEVDYTLRPTPYFMPASITRTIEAISGESHGTFGEVRDVVGKVVDLAASVLLNDMGFGGNSLIEVDVGINVKKGLVPLHLIAGSLHEGPYQTRNLPARNRLLELREYRMHERVSIIGDSWALGDGRDVDRGGLIKGSEEESAYHKQVNRMIFAKGFLSALRPELPPAIEAVPNAVTNFLSQAQTPIEAITGIGRFGMPLDARVHSINSGANGGNINVFTNAGVTPEGSERADYPTLEADKTNTDRRGQYFMGCKTPQRGNCDFR